MSLAAKLFRGSALNLLEHVTKLTLMFVTTPLLIRELGEIGYGTWLLALTIVGYLKLLDLGLSHAGTRFLGKLLGAQDETGYSALARSLLRIYFGLGVLSLLSTALAVIALPAIVDNSNPISTIRLLVAGFGFVTAIRFCTLTFEVILKSHVRYDLIGIASIARASIQGGLVIYFLLGGHGILALFVIHLGCDLLHQAILISFARKMEPKFRIFTKGPEKDQRPVRLRDLITYSGVAVLTNTGQVLKNGVDTLVIARMSGLTMIPTYNIGARFLSIFSDLINAIFGGGFLAAFSQLDGRNDPHFLRKSFLNSLRLSSALATLGGSALILYGPSFIERWVGPEFSDSGNVLLILTPPYVLFLMQYPVWGFLFSQNQQKHLAVLNLAGGAFNLLLSVALTIKMGFFGVVWATLIETTLFYGILVPLVVRRVASIPIRTYFHPILRGFLIVSLFSALWWGLIRSLIEPDFLRLVALGSGHLLFLLPVILILVLNKKERHKLRKLLPLFS